MTQLQRWRTNYPLPINRDAEAGKERPWATWWSFWAVMEQYCTLTEAVKSRHEMLSKCTELYTHTHEWAEALKTMKSEYDYLTVLY